MFTKIKRCLFYPREIAAYFNEKFYKSFLLLLVLSLIAIIPYSLMEIRNTHISGSTYQTIYENLKSGAFEGSDLEINDYKLSGSKGLIVEGNEGVVVFNILETTGIEDVYTISSAYLTVPVVLFNTDNVKVYLLNKEVYSTNYKELEFNDFKMAEVIKNEYLQMDKLFNALDVIHVELAGPRIIMYSIMLFISRIISLFIVSLLIAILTKMFYYYIPFGIRFKVCFDCQMITVLFGFIYYLTGFSFFGIIGEIMSFIYAMMALKRIVPVKLEVKEDQVNGN